MGVLELLGVLLLGGAAWLLWDSLKARERANVAIRGACEDDGFLFLNDTVGLESIRPVRGEAGHVVLRRVYGFEYSDTGHNRRKGAVTLIGDTVSEVDLGRRLAAEGETWH